MAEFLSLWLEARGHGHVRRFLDFGTRWSRRYFIYGLALVATLQVLHAGFAVLLRHP